MELSVISGAASYHAEEGCDRAHSVRHWSMTIFRQSLLPTELLLVSHSLQANPVAA